MELQFFNENEHKKQNPKQLAQQFVDLRRKWNNLHYELSRAGIDDKDQAELDQMLWQAAAAIQHYERRLDMIGTEFTMMRRALNRYEQAYGNTPAPKAIEWLTIDQVILTASRVLGINVSLITGPTRFREIVDARKIITHICRGKKMEENYTTIGKFLNKDHSSVIHYERQHIQHILSDKEYADKYHQVLQACHDVYNEDIEISA